MLADGCGIPGLAVPGAGCPAEGSSRQESFCLINLGLANALAACAVLVDHNTGEVPLSGEGKAALQECLGCLGEGFSTHRVFFRQPEPPCCPRSVPTFVWFLCLVCLCEPCNVFQMRLCAAARAFVCFLLDRWLWPVM